MPGHDPPVGELTDTDLMTRAGRGDRDAFALIVLRHQARVFRLARAITSSHGAAEDVLQQTFLAAWQGAARFRGDASVVTWLLTIARNAAWHDREREQRAPVDDTPVEEFGIQAGWGSNPELLAVNAQEQRLLEAAFARLAADDRHVLTLRDVEGLSGSDTAAAMGVAVPAMKSRLHRARMRLAVELRKGGAGDHRRP